MKEHQPTAAADIKRFESKIQKGSGCWEWVGSKNAQGYGRFPYKRKTVLAHRFSYALHFGPIPRGSGFHGTCVCHRCDNPGCVNPNHLFLATSRENTADKVVTGRQVRFIGERNQSAKLPESDVREIRTRRKLGESQESIASDFGICRATISSIDRGITWSHI